jgi:hypothetical protein
MFSAVLFVSFQNAGNFISDSCTPNLNLAGKKVLPSKYCKISSHVFGRQCAHTASSMFHCLNLRIYRRKHRLNISTTGTTCDPAHYLLTYLLTQWSTVLLEKLTGLQLVKKFPALYGTRRFITAFTGARHLSLTWASSIQSIPPHPTSWRSNQHTTHSSHALH